MAKKTRRVIIEGLTVSKQDILCDVPVDVPDDQIMNWMVEDYDRWVASIVDAKDWGEIGSDERILDVASKKVLIDWGGWRGNKPATGKVVTKQIPPWEWADDDLPKGFTR